MEFSCRCWGGRDKKGWHRGDGRRTRWNGWVLMEWEMGCHQVWSFYYWVISFYRGERCLKVKPCEKVIWEPVSYRLVGTTSFVMETQRSVPTITFQPVVIGLPLVVVHDGPMNLTTAGWTDGPMDQPWWLGLISDDNAPFTDHRLKRKQLSNR